ncbi:beta strand repeat-containing protein, partial [Paralimibaculum aggregatum]|uniref:beta strand repeat-containing protein n=1 Tax=Paralimibaculum aggregatum TaxID=3036245 RepID=UPI002555FB4C
MTRRAQSSRCNFRLLPVQLALLTTSSVLALAISAPAQASCTSATITQASGCENDPGTWFMLSYTKPAAKDGEPGTAGQDYLFKNLNTTPITLSGDVGADSETRLGLISFYSWAADGSADRNDDATRGGDGGSVEVQNQAPLTATDISFDVPPSSGGTLGYLASDAFIGGITIGSFGGNGGNADEGSDVSGGDGGHGGGADYARITNSGAITLDTDFPNAGIGIYAATYGGSGGRQDSAAGDDQFGGDGGDVNFVRIDNSGDIRLEGAVASALWGIGAEAMAGSGGEDASAGGQANQVYVTNSGDITLDMTGSLGTISQGVRGIYAATVAGHAYWYSYDGSDAGGQGGTADNIEIVHSGDITVTAHGLAAPSYTPLRTPPAADPKPGVPGRIYSDRSAGIYLLSVGGDGGAGPGSADAVSSADGGRGGDASSSDGAGDPLQTSFINLSTGTITTDGDHIVGVMGELHGGKGGYGINESSGGNGGDVGPLNFELYMTDIETLGDNARGLVGLSFGGNGGAYSDDQFTVINVGDTSAGSGAPGGTIRLAADGASVVTTHGVSSHAIHLESAGGVAGDAEAGFAFINTPGADTVGGNGGAGGTISTDGTITAVTLGDYAHGMLFQSIAGGGGDATSDSNQTGLFVIGGAGGYGGGGGFIDLSSDLLSSTSGDASIGLLAQSIGGGGGNGGSTGGIVSVGGAGGTGGDGGHVKLGSPDSEQNYGLYVDTAGDYSYGVQLQSIGGGGGNGGDAFDFSVIIPAVGVGGDGGQGGDGGTAEIALPDRGTLNNDYRVTTSGYNSHALFVQSIGGGGGSGGDATGTDIGIVSVQIAGGADSDPSDSDQGGGHGGTAKVEIINSQSSGSTTISTAGDHAIGILTQSIGGGGGTGGNAIANTIDFGLSLAAAVGGDGGLGGSGGTASVVLDTAGTIVTGTDDTDDTTDAHGIVAQSIGGGGGVGGSSISRAFTQAIGTASLSAGLAFSASAGGVGGSGGSGGTGSIDLSGITVETRGDSGFGLLAQSIGGGGGIAGSASAINALRKSSNTYSGKVNFVLGADGGGGGDGHTASASAAEGSQIITWDDFSNAMVAQSVGAGGGVAGPGSTNSYPFSSGFGLAVDLALGATGGSGGSGGSGTVTLGETSTVTTNGSEARGLVAQSIGGGGGISQGGSLGFKFPAGGVVKTLPSLKFKIKLGQTGGEGGNGSSAGGRNDGLITTYGGGADGVLVQSIGGGGGLGGAISNDVDRLKEASNTLTQVRNLKNVSLWMDFTVSMGGAGGTGGDGGSASFTQSGTISTLGDHADGVVVQSIGGGGGVGGGVSSQGSESGTSIQMNLGGEGGQGGNGGPANLSFGEGNSIATQGYGAFGALVQSIGGGGGDGGSGSDRILGITQLGFSGADGPDNQDAGTVSATGPAAITTLGMDAPAMVLQSIAGGGGTSLMGNALVAQITALDEDSTQLGEPGYVETTIATGNGTIDGGTAEAGTVSYSGTVDIATRGTAAYGILAQSIGGGGGFAPTLNQYNTSATLGNGDGTGGDVSVTLSGGTISTEGVAAHGIVAQSIGGGGGIAGAVEFDPITTDIDGETASFGDGGAVTIDSAAAISVSGRWNAYGIFAQSIGGGGGFAGSSSSALPIAGSTGGGDSTGSGGPVTITTTAPIIVDSIYASPIFAQSVGPDGGGPITVDVGSEVILLQTPQNDSAGIKVVGGSIRDGQGVPTNRVTVRQGATVAVDDPEGSSSYAILYLGESEQNDDGLQVVVESGATVSGSIYGLYADGSTGTGIIDQQAAAAPAAAIAGTAAMQVHNMAGGTLRDATLYAGDIRNDGLILLGDRLEVIGDFTQGSGATLEAPLPAEGGDILTIRGDARLAGTLKLAPLAVAFGDAMRVVTIDGSLEGRFDDVVSYLFLFEQRIDGD